MVTPLVFVTAACLLMGFGVLLAIAVNTRGPRSGGGIAEVLYDTEHPEERRGRTARPR